MERYGYSLLCFWVVQNMMAAGRMVDFETVFLYNGEDFFGGHNRKLRHVEGSAMRGTIPLP